MTDSKAIYAAFASVIAAMLIQILPLPEAAIKALEGQQYHLRLLVEMSIHAIVQAVVAYWAVWWAPPNAPEIPQ